MDSSLPSRQEHFSQWYVDLILRSKLADYGPVKGTMVIRPYGYAIWERIQQRLDKAFKASGHTNAYFPLLIPESFLAKEAEHVEGFSPQTAVVTHGGGEKLEEPLVIRPTSETIIWSMYKKWIHSHRDLPLLINQWVNVMRWEKRTRLFLRTNEFLWQEGHTAHARSADAIREAEAMIGVYHDFAKDFLALAVYKGKKSASERFAGAVDSYSIEALMQDGKALQAGTSHYLGQNFARAFDVRFQNENGQEEYVWATSWGVSTRLIGAVILAHGDDKGLVLPPALAPTEIVCIPIYTSNNKDMILMATQQYAEELRKAGIRVELDDTQNSPGWKFAEWELRGVPIRLEYGARDHTEKRITVVRRDNGEKAHVPQAHIIDYCRDLLEKIQKNMWTASHTFTTKNTIAFDNYDGCMEYLNACTGFAEILWDGETTSEEHIKEKTSATSRIILEELKPSSGEKCIVSGKPARYRALFARNY